MRSLWKFVVLAVVAACSDADPVLDAESLSASGPYPVGFRALEMEYLPPLSDEPRTSRVLVWYPSETATGEMAYYGLSTSERAITDAKPSADLGPRPVLLYSHGSQAYPAVASYLTEHLASHGYIVVAPAHTGNTLGDGSERDTEIYFNRPTDIARALDRASSAAELIGEMSDQVAVAGHSFGGYTAISVAGASYDMEALEGRCGPLDGSGICRTWTSSKAELFRQGFGDDRVRLAISMDAGDVSTFGEGLRDIKIPVLLMDAHDTDAPEPDSYFSRFENPETRRVRLIGGGHNDFVDSCGLGIKFRCSDLEASAVHPHVRAYVLAFLSKHFSGDASAAALLDGEIKISPIFKVDSP